MKPIILELKLTVMLDPQGESVETLKHQMYQVVRDAVNEGTLTGETAATVEDYKYTVEQLPCIDHSPNAGCDCCGMNDREEGSTLCKECNAEQQRRDEKNGLYGDKL